MKILKKTLAFSALCMSCFMAHTLLAQDALYSNTFPLGDVKILDGPFLKAQQLNLHVMEEYDTNRLLAPFLIEAGLEPKGELFDNWKGLDGHVLGHYLSALSISYAATGSEMCRERMEYIISELSRVQEANGDGYIGGVPDSKRIWGALRRGEIKDVMDAWVPWYNLHKTFAGLRDAWMYGGSDKARDMFLKLCDWAVEVTAALSDETMDKMCDLEFGGMNESLADAYALTGDEKYMHVAKRFCHKDILDKMACGVDNLDKKHANTQVPKIVGYARIADLAGSAYHRAASEFFWERVVKERSVVIGGNSRNEHFPAVDDYKSYVEYIQGPETCNTNNMLKLTELLFKDNPKAEYADFFEKALFNHILSSQHPEHGGFVYFTSMRPGHYRVYSQPNQAMWCCVGTGMENHGKYGEFIYTKGAADELYVNLFIASELSWKEKGLTIAQNTLFPYSDTSTLTVQGSGRFTMMVRLPSWAADGYSVVVDGKDYARKRKPGCYVRIEREWKDGDKVEIKLPMANTVQALVSEDSPMAGKNLASTDGYAGSADGPENFLAICRGPIVLAVRTSDEGLDGLVAGDGRWDHEARGAKVDIEDTPILVGTRAEIEKKVAALKPLEGRPLCLSAAGLFNKKEYDKMVLEPFFSLHDSRYAVYFLRRDAVQKKIFTGYDGGMLIHTGYLFGTIAPMGCYKVSGAPIGIGGTARIHLKKHWRVGFEGYFSSMGVMKNGSYIKYGWGGVLADAYWNIGRFMPYAGLTIGGGANSDLFIMDKSSKDLHNSWEPTQQSVIHKQGFMVIDPYVGCDYVVSKAFHLTLKLDWMNCISRESSTIPTGPRVYFGFLFYH